MAQQDRIQIEVLAKLSSESKKQIKESLKNIEKITKIQLQTDSKSVITETQKLQKEWMKARSEHDKYVKQIQSQMVLEKKQSLAQEKATRNYSQWWQKALKTKELAEKKASAKKYDTEYKALLKQEAIEEKRVSDEINAYKKRNRQAYISWWQSTLTTQESKEKAYAQSIKDAHAEALKINEAKKQQVIENQKLAKSQDKLSTNMTNVIEKTNHAVERFNKFGSPSQRNNVEKLSNEIKQLATDIKNGNGDINKMQNELSELETRFRSATQAPKTFGEEMRSTFAKFGQWIGVSTVVFAAIQQVRQAATAVLELDAALVELKKVSDLTTESQGAFVVQASKVGDVVGATTADITQATSEFARMGYSVQQSLDLAEQAQVLVNIGDGITDVTQAAGAMVSILKGFNIDASESGDILDKLNEVSNNFAVTTEDLTSALQRSGATMATTGNSLDQTIGILTSAIEVLRDSERASTAIRTVSLRLQGMSKDGESIAQLSPKIQKYFDEYKTGVKIMNDATGEFNSTYDILTKLAESWERLEPAQRANLTQLIAGKRSADAFNAVMQNMASAIDATNTSINSQGSAMAENDIVMESLQKRIDLFKKALDDLYQNSIESGFLISLVDMGTGLVNIIDKIGILNVLLMTTVGVLSTKYLGAILSATGVTTSFTVAIASANAALLFMGGAAVIGALIVLGNVLSKVGKSFSELNGIISENSQKAKENINRIKELKDRYRELALQTDLDATAKKELLDIEHELKTGFSDTSSAIDLQNGSLSENIKLIDQLTKKEAERFLRLNERAYQKAKDPTGGFASLTGYENFDQIIADAEQALEEATGMPEWIYQQRLDRLQTLYDEKKAVEDLIAEYEYYQDFLGAQTTGDYQDFSMADRGVVDYSSLNQDMDAFLDESGMSTEEWRESQLEYLYNLGEQYDLTREQVLGYAESRIKAREAESGEGEGIEAEFSPEEQMALLESQAEQFQTVAELMQEMSGEDFMSYAIKNMDKLNKLGIDYQKILKGDIKQQDALKIAQKNALKNMTKDMLKYVNTDQKYIDIIDKSWDMSFTDKKAKSIQTNADKIRNEAETMMKEGKGIEALGDHWEKFYILKGQAMIAQGQGEGNDAMMQAGFKLIQLAPQLGSLQAASQIGSAVTGGGSGGGRGRAPKADKEPEQTEEERRAELLDYYTGIFDSLFANQMKVIEAQIEAEQAILDAKEEENELEEKMLAIEEAKLALLEAQEEKTARIFDVDQGKFVQMADPRKIEDAQEDLADAQEDYDEYVVEQEQQSKIDVLEKQAEELEELQELVENILSNEGQYVGSQVDTWEDLMKALERFGVSYEEATETLGFNPDQLLGSVSDIEAMPWDMTMTDIATLQAALKELGLYSGGLTGFEDESMRDALARFQRAYGLEETGYLDIPTKEAFANAKVEDFKPEPSVSYGGGGGGGDYTAPPREIIYVPDPYMRDPGSPDYVGSRRFANGGLTTKTGLMWGDGSLAEPERVLNPQQTMAFDDLVYDKMPILSSFMSNLMSGTGDTIETQDNNPTVYIEGDLVVQANDADEFFEAMEAYTNFNGGEQS